MNRFLLLPILLLIVCVASARPDDLSDTARQADPLSDIDHAAVLKNLNKSTLERGRLIYTKSCIACHGVDGTASYSQARSFGKDKLRFGNSPYDMWRTVSRGAGLMAPQTWLSPTERYYVIQYIRETFIKKSNPGQYYKITDQYLAVLPRSRKSQAQQETIARNAALTGSQKYGQDWFSRHPGNYGTAIHSQLKDHVPAALTVLLSDHINLSYNLHRMSVTAVWRGSLDLSETKYRRYRGEGQPFIKGRELTGLDCWQWYYGGRFDSLQQATGVRAPFPAGFLDYHGHYQYGKDVILSYAINGRDVLELPRAIHHKGQTILSQTLYIAPGTTAQQLYIGRLKGATQTKSSDSSSNITVLQDRKSGCFLAIGILSSNQDRTSVSPTISSVNKELPSVTKVLSQPTGDLPAFTNPLTSQIDDQQRIVLTIPASEKPLTIQVLRIAGVNPSVPHAPHISSVTVLSAFIKSDPIPDLQSMIHGSPAQRTQTVKTTGVLDTNRAHFDPIFREDSDRMSPGKAVDLPPDYPYTVDNVGLPFDNAWQSWIRPTCLGFLSDGRLVIGTYMGDVWVANGIDDSLKNIGWRRIAAGLFECMGLKVVQDHIYVTTRNGIVLLHDLNGDGETDFYENFYSDPDVSSFFHAFNFGLETDSKGNFYYTKVGEYTDNKDAGNVIKVSPDGKKWESIATGFRVDNGLTISPDDKIFVSDNQGNWEPANKICLIDKNDSYGYVPNLYSGKEWSPDGKTIIDDQTKDGVILPKFVPVPDTFHQPALWMPQEFDNSPGGGVWSDKTWGPLGNQFIHTSYGTGWVYYFLPQQVDNVTQGAMVALPFQLDAGIQRAAVNPKDKQVYVTGLTGWDDPEAVRYGVLSRIRYRGGEGHLLKGAGVAPGGVKLLFNVRLDEESCKNIGSYQLAQWNYKWSSDYGSAHYSVRTPGKEGEDQLTVQQATIGDNGYSLTLAIPDIGPAQTVRLRFTVKAADGATIKNSIYLTIHKIPK